MARKRRQITTQAKAGAESAPQQQPEPAFSPLAMQNGLRLISLLAGVAVGIWVFELFQAQLGFWPALIVGFVAAFIARAVMIWLEGVWLRAAIRRAKQREAERQARQPKANSKKREASR